MTISIHIQRACTSEESPDDESIHHWVTTAVRAEDNLELSIRIVDEQESAQLNHRYREKTGPTNVLSFPFDAVVSEPLPILGDLVICAPVVAREATQQHKSINAHWAHMIIHGVLHLLGYDHSDEKDSEIMESLETEILLGLDFPAPYLEPPSDRQPSECH
ncbi:MAG: rRNA maturation RNase YbeY [Porticoccaceae bacterium]|nr:rRNA maturation RNase YbeY [Porticoccaceae bacterium]